MLNFCTLFDSFYLSRGLVMYESLQRHTDGFHLYIFAFDSLSYEILISLHLENVTVISLDEFENEELLKVKDTRTKAEYCWTCTPSTIDYVFKTYRVNSCTYLDADLFFYGSPLTLLEELDGKKSVLITEHRFSKIAKLHEQKRAGRFCVQFITFTNAQESQRILTTWKNQCITWCYARYEDGKFGDQKYLDEWPILYDNVHILEHLGGGVAPWNVQQYRFVEEKDGIFGYDKKTRKRFNVIFFHFHFVRFLENEYIDIGWNYLPNFVKKCFYRPYISKIIKKERELEEINNKYKFILYRNNSEGIKEAIKTLFKKATKFNRLKEK